MPVTKICKHCEKVFYIPKLKNNGGYSKKFCSVECRKKEAKKQSCKQIVYKKPKKSIIEIEAAANEKNMTYGQYVLFLAQEKARKKKNEMSKMQRKAKNC